MRLLRKDLERCRLLLELIKKREKIKLQKIQTIKEILELETNPLHYTLNSVIDFFLK